MHRLVVSIDIRDFDLDRIGFVFCVLDSARKTRLSEAYIQMTPAEFDAFLNALKAAGDDILVGTMEQGGVRRAPAPGPGRPAPLPPEIETAIENELPKLTLKPANGRIEGAALVAAPHATAKA